jgi:hypothetical protein
LLENSFDILLIVIANTTQDCYIDTSICRLDASAPRPLS